MQNIDYQVILVRALKTFAQAFVAVFLTGLTVNVNQVQLKALLIGAFAAGVSALMNAFIKPQEAK